MNEFRKRLMCVLGYSHTVYCSYCGATYGSDVELAGHIGAAHPGGRS